MINDAFKQYLEEKFSGIHSKIELSINPIIEKQNRLEKELDQIRIETRVVRFFSKYPRIASMTIIGLLSTNLVSLFLLIKKMA